eukprot:gene12732-8681_t
MVGPPSAYPINSSRIKLCAEEPPADQSVIDMLLKRRIGAGLVGGGPRVAGSWHGLCTRQGVFSGPPSAYPISSSRITLYAEEPPADENGVDGIFSGPPSAYPISSSRIKLCAEEPPADQSVIAMLFLKRRIGAGLVGGGPRVAGSGMACAPGKACSADQHPHIRLPPADENGVDVLFLKRRIGAGLVRRGPRAAVSRHGLCTRGGIFSGPTPAYSISCSYWLIIVLIINYYYCSYYCYFIIYYSYLYYLYLFFIITMILIFFNLFTIYYLYLLFLIVVVVLLFII